MRRVLCVALALSCLLLVGAADAVTQYILTPLKKFGSSYAAAYDVNESGWAVGVSETRAVMWKDGALVDIGTYSGYNSEARAINDAGLVVGNANNRAFLYTGMTYKLLGSFGGGSEARGVNNLGQIVGSAEDADGYSRGFIYQNGVMSRFPSDTPYGFLPYDINDNGVMAGATGDEHGFAIAARWENGVVTPLGTFGTECSVAEALNNAGQLVGNYGSNNLAFLWQDGTMQDLGTFGENSFALDINSEGVIVGCCSAPPSFRAFVWEKGRMYDLNSLVEETYGWILTEAFGINDRGQIVGTAITSSGDSRAFLLTPVPIAEPSMTAAAAALGLLLALMKARRN